MFLKLIQYFDRPAAVACDARCDKAWGWHTRPHVKHDPNDPDAITWLPDGELGTAPRDPGTTEGGHSKPTSPESRMNMWCCHECERRAMASPGQMVELTDWSRPVHNLESKHEGQD